MADMLLSEASGPLVDISTLSHLRAWQSIVTSSPDKIALISHHQPPRVNAPFSTTADHDASAKWTYAELDSSARRLATTLNRLMLDRRQPIAVLLDNQAEWLLCFWAAAYLHSPLVPINPNIASRSEELHHILNTIRPSTIIVAGAERVRELEQSLSAGKHLDNCLKVMVTADSEEALEGWQDLYTLMRGDLTPPDTPIYADPEETAIILFTSGTTSLPKPCAISSAKTANAAYAYHGPMDIRSDDIYLSQLPNFHSYGIGWMLSLLLKGGTIVLPSASFQAQASVECIERYAITHMSLVPTTAQTILTHPSLRQTDLSSLRGIDISGAGASPSVIESCESLLHVPVGTSFGMTESPTTLLWSLHDGRAIKNGEVYSGRPARGAKVKICAPGTRSVLERGTAGELHCGGVQVIDSYLAPDARSEAFYVDEHGTNWLMSGDQAIMGIDGTVRICGRYKDLIIRGGENISPASVEACLQKVAGVHAVQVIGIPDELAGEVPIAIIQPMPGITVSAGLLKATATKALGTAFAPKMVLDLWHDLRMAAFPTTAAGKIRKVELAAIVRDYFRQRQTVAIDKSAPTILSLLKIWQRISGCEELVSTTSIQSFADSLMMMQLSHMVKQDLDKDIMVEDFKTCLTVQAQADLIDSRSAQVSVATLERHGPPVLYDIPHLAGDQTAFLAMQGNVSATLENHKLSWSDVEEISPLSDWNHIFATRCRPQSWTLRYSFHSSFDMHVIESGLKLLIRSHPILRSIVVRPNDETSLLVSMRAGQEWYEAAWTSSHAVKHKDDLNTLLLDDPELDSAGAGGPMFRVHLASISDGSSGFVVVASHAVSDMTMTKLWMDDLAAILAGRTSIAPHLSPHDYNVAYHRHRQGRDASEGVSYWTSKLKGIGSLPESSFWPTQRAPEYFKGNDAGWSRVDGRPGRPYERRQPLNLKREAQAGVRRLVQVRDISLLKSEHDVPIFMLVKSAIALMNVRQTKASVAYFGTLNAARKWPFSSDYDAADQARYSGNPLNISGCTTEYVLDCVRIDETQNVVSFMQQVTADEEQNSRYAKTPFLRITDALRQPLCPEDTRTWLARDRDGDAVLSAIRRQSFNWLPTAPTSQNNGAALQMTQLLSRMDNGLTITGFLAEDKHSVVLSFTWDAEHLTYEEANAALDQLATLVRVLGQAENWEKTVGGILMPLDV